MQNIVSNSQTQRQPIEKEVSPFHRVMSDDLISRIVDGMVTNDPVETARNISNLKLSNKSVKESVERSAGGRFHGQINRLGAASKALYDHAVPTEGFSEHPEFRPALPRDYALAGERIDAIGGTLKLQTPQRKSALVDHILNIAEPYDQGHALEYVAPHVGEFGSEDRRRLVEKMLEHFSTPFTDELPSDENFSGTYALFKALPHMEDSLKARMLDTVVNNPDMAALIQSQKERYDWLRAQDEYEKATWRSTQKPTVDERLADIESSVRSNLSLGQGSDLEKMRSARPLQQTISDTLNLAREELKSRAPDVRGR
ncbi:MULTISPECIES: hypothetical protein [Agrobacterium tumefaciens complex]|uniref:Uncharacterized protein n=1 Tax=Agrobacterium fabrum TaxID=1176649 RepID=A0A2Z2PGF4_9HYPH|nr:MULTISPECIES: hypothetical protein [Agrobacterium tumefaciens complex]ASK42017.1 hypothetical protein [Agrobacterium fabrum]NSL21998.1 hypothetical protein [Agrobacterium tumefaciens]NTC53569.1 hypothetical protein [Agrobacterium tumefaciens]NTC59763.1 hypothetical protein [Agrobacterium tumefaciens]NTC67248.1 hypothetical protein [Agrobacterium tumefaciens]